MPLNLVVLHVLLLVLPIWAEPQNTTIDDTSSLIDYRGFQTTLYCSDAQPCFDDGGKVPFNTTPLFNSTITHAQSGSLILDFTGTAVYMFSIVAPNDHTNATVSIDSVDAGRVLITANVSLPTAYNVSIFQQTALKQGSHVLNMTGDIWLDYFVITSDSDLATSSAASSSVASTSTSTALPNTHSTLTSGAKAGIAVGAVALVALLGVVLFLVLRGRNEARGKPHEPECPPDQPDSPSNGAEHETDLIAEMRMVRSQVERLAEQQKQALQEGSSRASVFSDTESTVTRSVSTMKRDQSRVLRATNSTATNSMVYTDSGLRLSAGAAIEEAPPPEYVSE
ncbi:hypothetical protein DFH06DRAFT_1122126 [Mycena polygramma]|nr:hypothetical protein DFH06DRAFT_1122126 [Mycena polygramma]